MDTVQLDLTEAHRTRLAEAMNAYEVLTTDKKNRREIGAAEQRRVETSLAAIKEALQYEPVILERDAAETARTATNALANLQRQLAEMRRLSAAARADLVETTEELSSLLAQALGEATVEE